MNTNHTRILLSAGATQEALDDVRFLGNRSSGKLGALLAFAAARQGYDVTILYGLQAQVPTAHPRITSIPFSSTRDLHAKLVEQWPSHSILIMAAAVADFTPVGGKAQGKVAREDGQTVELAATQDIVADLASKSRNDQRILAFALEESTNLRERAQAKLQEKNVDAIVANPLETMDGNTIHAQIFRKGGSPIIPEGITSKSEFSSWLIEHLDEILQPTK